jgi:predicted ABC-type exoprotein transport system permease subunit
MASLTFLDVVVVNERIADRALFDGLVHAVQFHILGLKRYSDLFVRGFLKTNAPFAIPLEAHALALASRFARNTTAGFSVEEQVRLWIREGRY